MIKLVRRETLLPERHLRLTDIPRPGSLRRPHPEYVTAARRRQSNIGALHPLPKPLKLRLINLQQIPTTRNFKGSVDPVSPLRHRTLLWLLPQRRHIRRFPATPRAPSELSLKTIHTDTPHFHPNTRYLEIAPAIPKTTQCTTFLHTFPPLLCHPKRTRENPLFPDPASFDPTDTLSTPNRLPKSFFISTLLILYPLVHFGKAGRGGALLIGYARVSTRDQTPEMQIGSVRVADCEKIFTENVSGHRAAVPNSMPPSTSCGRTTRSWSGNSTALHARYASSCAASALLSDSG